MKKLLFFFVFLLLCNSLYSQDIKVQTFIGKPINDAIAYYGKPAYQDKTNPAMICTFFQLKDRRYVVISDETNIYQVQADLNYNSESEANSALSTFIKNCIGDGYTTDTVNTAQFRIHKKGSLLDVNISPLDAENKFTISIKANKSED